MWGKGNAVDGDLADQLKKWRRLLHEFDPKTKEEEDELQSYLRDLGETTLTLTSVCDESEEEDMSLWDLL